MLDEDPVAEFDISGLDEFEIRASCSQHWLWGTGFINIEEYHASHESEWENESE
jgi:hypothetical protein